MRLISRQVYIGLQLDNIFIKANMNIFFLQFIFQTLDRF